MTVTSHCPVAQGIPVLDADPFAAQSLEDPLPFQRQLRDAGPVAYLSKYGVYAIGRFAELSQALSNWQGLISGAGVGIRDLDAPKGLLQTDPPLHDAPREVLQEILSARALRAMKDTCMTRVAGLLDQHLGHGASGEAVEIDGLSQIAHALPVEFFPDASGIDESARDKFVDFADHNFNTAGPYNDLVKAGECKAAELATWMGQKCQRDALKPEGFGADIWAAADRGEILHENAALLASSLIAAGIDTTIYGIAGMLYALATNPGQWELVKQNPGLARVAFDEALRWSSPVQAMFRKSSQELQIGGVTIPAGAKVLMCYPAANRDPRRWDNPDKFDVTRDPSGHLAFGMGVHQCVGQHAARLQAACLLEQLVDRVEKIELVGQVKYHHNNVLRGWSSVPLRFTLK
ncbi:cytochrome P450 [Glutamicibacter uratoxydans]|uniref:Cytochrome P450 n=1 Tax=Glutamicibacter uratoxydans TaxID=43667 RepID=A0A4Y4DP49_GLUUR|nr:cytochrome P450 [Glutamicibacter uratoxydans]GED06377.1 cytochrome P450 [Glutamicibacter uratoxydans]